MPLLLLDLGFDPHELDPKQRNAIGCVASNYILDPTFDPMIHTFSRIGGEYLHNENPKVEKFVNELILRGVDYRHLDSSNMRADEIATKNGNLYLSLHLIMKIMRDNMKKRAEIRDKITEDKRIEK